MLPRLFTPLHKRKTIERSIDSNDLKTCTMFFKYVGNEFEIKMFWLNGIANIHQNFERQNHQNLFIFWNAEKDIERLQRENHDNQIFAQHIEKYKNVQRKFQRNYFINIGGEKSIFGLVNYRASGLAKATNACMKSVNSRWKRGLLISKICIQLMIIYK